MAALFLVNGLGMGNSTRCHALMQYLAPTGLAMHVMTSGNGLHYFRGKGGLASVTPMQSFAYGVKDGELSAWRTVGSVRSLARALRAKLRQIEDVVAAVRPAFCVTDSEYAIRPLRKRGIPVIALNNSDVVVGEYLRRRGTPRDVRAQFWAVEFPDYLFHRQMADLVLSPAATPLPPRHPRVRRVGLIVRREIEAVAPAQLPPPRRARDFRRLTFMMSGSTLGHTVGRIGDLAASGLPYEISVVGMEGAGSDRVKYYGKLADNVALLQQADMLVINGGFSAVSEALALGKPTLVIPVPRHAEQYVNARQVVDLGFGDVLDAGQDVVGYLRRAHAENRFVGRPDADASPPAPVDFGGARQAADALLEFLGRRGILPAARPAGAAPAVGAAPAPEVALQP